MKKLLTLALAFVALAGFIGLGVAQRPKIPTRVETQQPPTGKMSVGGIDDASAMLMTGKVIRDNHTFTVMSNGKEVTFNAANLKVFPKVGEIILITYTENPGGPMTTSFGNKPPVDPCASVRCIAPKVCGLDENNLATCVEKTATAARAWPRWCCWFGECRFGCGNRGYGPHF